MKINVLEKSDNEIKFVIEEIDEGLLNTIRRIAISEVPVMAIEEVEFTKNSSALYDEIIAHRLGLIPLKTDLKTYKLPSKCKCGGKGCNACSLKLSLNAKGPKVVYSGDLKSKDPKVVPAIDDIPIVKLLENQELKFNATAVLGIGKDHSKFSPCLMTFMNYPEIKVLSTTNLKKCLESCPRHLLKLNKNKVEIIDVSKCDLCGACIDACPNNLQMNFAKDKFIVYIESWGQLNVKDILLTSVKVLNDKLKEFMKALKL